MAKELSAQGVEFAREAMQAGLDLNLAAAEAASREKRLEEEVNKPDLPTIEFVVGKTSRNSKQLIDEVYRDASGKVIARHKGDGEPECEYWENKFVHTIVCPCGKEIRRANSDTWCTKGCMVCKKGTKKTNTSNLAKRVKELEAQLAAKKPAPVDAVDQGAADVLSQLPTS